MAQKNFATPLATLINWGLQSGFFPTSEKRAKVSPSYKADSKSSLDNYRPISVLTMFSKIIEKVVYLADH